MARSKGSAKIVLLVECRFSTPHLTNLRRQMIFMKIKMTQPHHKNLPKKVKLDFNCLFLSEQLNTTMILAATDLYHQTFYRNQIQTKLQTFIFFRCLYYSQLFYLHSN